MEKHNQSLAAALGGHQRRAISQRSPCAVVELGVRLSQHLAGNSDVGWDRHSVEWAVAREAGKLLWLVPAQAAAQDSATAPQFYRDQIIITPRKVRSCKSYQNPAIVDPLVQTVQRVDDIADIREDQHRQMTIQKARHCFGWCDAFGETDVGKWIERAGEVVGCADQRLRAICSGAGHDSDSSTAPAPVEKLHGARRALTNDFQSCHVVADFNRQIDYGVGLPLAGLEIEWRFAQRQTLEVDRTHRADITCSRLGTQHLHCQRACCVVGSRKRMRYRQAAFDNGQRAAADDALQALDEIGTLAEIDSIREPDHFD